MTEDERLRELGRRALAGDREAALELRAAERGREDPRAAWAEREFTTYTHRAGPLGRLRMQPRGDGVVRVNFGYRLPVSEGARTQGLVSGWVEYQVDDAGGGARMTNQNVEIVERTSSSGEVMNSLERRLGAVVAKWAGRNRRLLLEAEVVASENAARSLEGQADEALRRLEEAREKLADAVVSGLRARSELARRGWPSDPPGPPPRERPTAGPAPHTLDERRRMAAEREFAAFDFEREVAETGGWERSSDSREWTRRVFLDDGADGTNAVTYVVLFEPGTARVERSWTSV